VVTHQLQVERRTGKVRRPETDVLALRHATDGKRTAKKIPCEKYKLGLPQRTAQQTANLKGILGSPYSTAECRVPELIPVLGSQPAGEMSHKPGGRLPLLSVRPAVTVATLNRAATDFAAW